MGLLKKVLQASKKKTKKQPASVTPVLQPDSEFDWVGAGPFQRRAYPTYDVYAEHQKAKLARLDLTAYNQRFAEALEKRLALVSSIEGKRNVLCLGARTGAECAAFIKLGYFAVGIDLNPGSNNRYVVVGDFHELQYADESVDVVFTNALDHAFDLERIIREVHRVLRKDGVFIAEIVDPTVRGPGAFEAMWWQSVDDVVSVVRRGGLTPSERTQFTYPWQGTQVIFVK